MMENKRGHLFKCPLSVLTFISFNRVICTTFRCINFIVEPVILEYLSHRIIKMSRDKQIARTFQFLADRIC